MGASALEFQYCLLSSFHAAQVPTMRNRFSFLLLLAIGLPLRADDAPALEFFEKKVRPVLIDHCHSCHGEKKSMGGLRLDSRDAILKGSDTGPVVVVGQPDKSTLIKAVHYEGDYQMPPKGKLPPEAIAALTEWVKLGVPYPAGVAPKTPPVELAKNHWAFQPVKLPPVPMVKQAARVQTPVDAFILAALEAKQLTMSPPTDRPTLIRRLSFDLIGLPPTPAEVDAFVRDTRPDAVAQLVDRLLDSPHYGERWARYWLDLARYADTKGYVFQEDRNYPFAYTFRDYVIRSLNDDKPYDRFIIEQLAADQLDTKADPTVLAGMGFMTVGRRFLNSQPDIIDDRLDVLCRGVLGLTVTCARCHDHKFDPIPTKDYYSLYGVFASSTEPAELPLIAEPMNSPAYTKYLAEVAKREKTLNDYVAKRHADIIAQLRQPAVIRDYLLFLHESQGKDVAALARQRDLNPLMVQRWRDYLAAQTKAPNALFSLWQQAQSTAPEQLAALVQKFIAGGDAMLAPALAAKLKNAKIVAQRDLAEVYGHILSPMELLTQANSPTMVPLDQAERLFNRADQMKRRDLKKQLDVFKAKSAVAPARAMVMQDLPRPVDPVVFIRGNANNRGPQVPRQFLELLTPQRKPFTQGSGRLELAQAIVSPQNPLTARVFVNRVWTNHFGRGLVTTPSDFGVRSDPPSHPELLDYLATTFMQDGWSIKKLHRLMVLSSTYQQSSMERADLEKADPENRLLGRMNRRRLDFEALRDGLLAVSGKLDDQVGGKSVELFTAPYPTRRSLYAFIDRQNLPGTFRTFDFAIPDTHAPQRFQTTVPQQALFLLNSPFVIEQARALVSRPEVATQPNPKGKIDAMYRLLFGRTATVDEVQLALPFVAQGKSPTNSGPWSYGYGTIDEKTGDVQYKALPLATASTWQGGPVLPDPMLGWVMLNAAGGHPGNDAQHMSIRRFVVPTSGIYQVAGKLQHPSKDGDGVRGRIVTPDAVIGDWVAQGNEQNTSVTMVKLEKGDALDFVIDCRGNPNNDSHNWTVTIRREGDTQTWDSSRDFRAAVADTALTPWEQYAQVLLLANEFAFVD